VPVSERRDLGEDVAKAGRLGHLVRHTGKAPTGGSVWQAVRSVEPPGDGEPRGQGHHRQAGCGRRGRPPITRAATTAQLSNRRHLVGDMPGQPQVEDLPQPVVEEVSHGAPDLLSAWPRAKSSRG
jgi:hypothetical protein